jgi:hypothetical protein
MGFLADAWTNRYTVPSPIPSCAAIFAQESPAARRRPILVRSAITTRPAEPFALRTRVSQAGPDALGNQAALEFGHGAQDGETMRPARVAVSSDSDRLTNSN